jgi:hypothetical protein
LCIHHAKTTFFFIKSTLSNLPTYFLSLFPIPVGVANRLEKFQRDFLWKVLEMSLNSTSLIGLRIVHRRFRTGGLGVRNMIQFNRVLLAKWL